MDKIYDLIIVGAGPAGISAGIYAAERRLKTLILEANKPGGQLATLYSQKAIYDYPGIQDIPAGELAEKMRIQAVRFGVVIETGVTVREIGRKDKVFELQTYDKPYPSTVSSGRSNRFAKAVLIAVGMGFFQPRKLGIPGEELDGVHYIFPDPSGFKNKRVLCVGGGETALEGALTATKGGAAKVYVVHRREEFRGVEKTLDELRENGAMFMTPCDLVEISKKEDKEKVKRVIIINNKTQEKKTLEVDIVCIHIGFIPDASLVERWRLKMENRAVVVDRDMQTSKLGIFACGDITIPAGEFKRITIAQGQAAQAVHGIYKYLKNPYWK